MVHRLDKRKLLVFVLVLVVAFASVIVASEGENAQEVTAQKSYIKWFEMNVSLSALKDAMNLDIETYDKLYHISWIDTLSYLACQNGNNWSKYSEKDLNAMVEKLGDLYTVDDLMQGNKYYNFYKESFSAALGGLLGEYVENVLGRLKNMK